MEDKRFELRAELVTVEISDPQTGGNIPQRAADRVL